MDYDQKVMLTLLIDANGQLGSELWQAFGNHDLIPLTHAELELTNPVQVRETLTKRRPSLILNTAAYHPPLAHSWYNCNMVWFAHPLLRLLDRNAMCCI